MYVINPKKLIYLANPKTGSTSFGQYWLKKRFNFGGQEGVGIPTTQLIVTCDGFPHPQWGNHHGMDKQFYDQLLSRGYTAFTVIRNPYDHCVSWYHNSGRANCTFDHFIRNFDEIVSPYTLPNAQPGNPQVLTKWAQKFARFENLEEDLSEIMGEKVELGHYNQSQNRKPHYREYYESEDQIARVTHLYRNFLLDFPFYTF
jgi:hypothetical protein